MFLEEVVTTSDRVSTAPARNEKTGLLAQLLARTPPDVVSTVARWLTGDTTQGRIGVGWATLSGISVPPAAESTLTVEETERTIAVVAATSGAGSVERRRALLLGLLRRATQAESDFLRRLLLGELRQGALQGVMVEAIAKVSDVPGASVRRALMLNGDVGETARIALTLGKPGLATVRLRLLGPVQPMLAASSQDVDDALADVLAGSGASRIEYKFDGVRIQVHRQGGDIRVFTRSLNDITERVPGIVEVATSLPGDAYVLDGELLGFVDEGRPGAFQETMSGLGRASEQPTRSAVRPFFFDVLHWGGDDLLDEPLATRLHVLEELAGPHRIPGIVTDEVEEARSFMARAIEAGHEGVVVKAMGGPYAAGRRGKSWRKVKPVHVFDLVVLAAEWGHGRRRGKLSNLHLGARDPRSGGFVMVGKTFKGLTDNMLAWQTEALLAREVASEGITVHVRPELVVEVAIDGVQTSTRYPGGVALRFARVRRYRPDKSTDEADTIDDLIRLGLPRSQLR